MCGIVGIFDMERKGRAHEQVVQKMVATLHHRGPDTVNYCINDHCAFGFSRLSIIDLKNGNQPVSIDNGTIVSMCNGEIFNYKALRAEYLKKGVAFATESDCETIPYLYRDKGNEFPRYINGQFAVAIYDASKHELLCCRDAFGICPLFYTIADGLFIFASEIKAIIQHPAVERKIDLVGIDQIFSFPGLISPRTTFKDIRSLRPGHLITVSMMQVKEREYWDIPFPDNECQSYNGTENEYIEELETRLLQSVSLRLQSDVPVGLYLSGGMDSMLLGAMIRNIIGESEHLKSFSIDFKDTLVSEGKFQRVGAKVLNTSHRECCFGPEEILERLQRVVYHTECPLKETFNTAAMALSELASRHGVRVILAGQGADEIFGGYIGYRFDNSVIRNSSVTLSDDEMNLRKKIWGDENYFYESNEWESQNIRYRIYSREIRETFEEINCFNHFIIDKEKITGLHRLNRRSYIDFKIRMADHLLGDHGDRMVMSNSIEGRYPFIDTDVVSFAAKIPPKFKINGLTEKYILKQLAKQYIPEFYVKREKFGFTSPGSPYLIAQNSDLINDMLSERKITEQGIFDPIEIRALRTQYGKSDFRINVPFQTDLLTIVITTGMLMDQFKLTL